MNAYVILLTICALVDLGQANRSQFSSIVAMVNGPRGSWTAALSAGIDYDNLDALKAKVGTIIALNNAAIENDYKTHGTLMNGLHGYRKNGGRRLQTAAASTSYPSSLDLRVQYPNCTSISLVRNQGSCSNCWAFGTMNSLSDRYCIAKSTNTTTQQKFFSVEDVLECCKECWGGLKSGCVGGVPYYAMLYAMDSGVVSGDVLSTGGLCKPFYLDITPNATAPPASCNTTCTNPQGYSVPYSLDRTYASGVVYDKGEQAMIAALNNGGTIVASFQVYQDFFTYSSGVYSYSTGSFVGSHSVRIIGYGTDNNGVNYWLVANSWGPYWGESGFFRMRRGTNECNIESYYFFAGTF